MFTLAFCQDSTRARSQREVSFAPHMQHLRAVLKDIRLGAPLATADGAAIKDDDRLVASVFVVETATASEANELMGKDPYTTGGVWQSIALFEAHETFATWSLAGGGLYVLFSEDTSSEQRRSLSEKDCLLVYAARLNFSGVIGAAPAPGWQSVAFVRAANFAAVKSMLSPHSAAWAIPVAVGSWPGVTNL